MVTDNSPPADESLHQDSALHQRASRLVACLFGDGPWVILQETYDQLVTTCAHLIQEVSAMEREELQQFTKLLLTRVQAAGASKEDYRRLVALFDL